MSINLKKIQEKLRNKLLSNIILIFVFLYTLFNYNQGIEFVDEGVLNMGAWRISEGEVPYRDFFIPYTPLSFYILGLLYKIFGVSILTGRIGAIFLSIVFIFSVFLLSKRVIGDETFASLPVIMMTQGGMAMWHFMSHHWIGDIFTIFSVYFFLVFLSRTNHKFLFLSGFLAGLCFITITDQGLYNVVLLFGATIILIPKDSKIRSLMSFLAGTLISSLPLFIYLVQKVPLSTLFYDLVIFPLTGYRSIEGNKMGILYPFSELIYVWKSGAYKYEPFWVTTGTLSSLTITLLPFIAVISFFFLIKKENKDKKSLVVLFLGALIMILTAARRWAPINLYWATSLPSILFALALFKIYKEKKKLLPLYILYFLIFIFFLLGTMKTAKLLDKSVNIRVESRSGVLLLDKPDVACHLIGLLNAIDHLIPEKEPFLSREIAIVNFLSLRKNPTKIDFFKPPNYSPKKQINEVINDLETKNIRFVVSLKKDFDESNPFEVYLSDKFSPVWENKMFVIHKRKNS